MTLCYSKIINVIFERLKLNQGILFADEFILKFAENRCQCTLNGWPICLAVFIVHAICFGLGWVLDWKIYSRFVLL